MFFLSSPTQSTTQPLLHYYPHSVAAAFYENLLCIGCAFTVDPIDIVGFFFQVSDLDKRKLALWVWIEVSVH